MHKRTKATAIPPAVRRVVENRDSGACIFCGRPGRGEAHVISRAQGGLGIEQNIVTVCRECHDKMDNSTERAGRVEYAEQYLRRIYPGWNKGQVIYRKGANL